MAEIEKELNISRQRISQIRQEILAEKPELLEVYQQRKETQYQQELARIKELVEHCSLSQISHKTGIPITRITKILKKEGISKPPKPPLIEKGTMIGLWRVGEMVMGRSRNGSSLRYYMCVCLGCGDKRKIYQGNLLSGASKGCLKCAHSRKK